MILASASSWSLGLGCAAVAAYLSSAVCTRINRRVSLLLLCLAWVLHGAVIVTGLWYPFPHFGFAAALSMTAWLVLLVYAVELRVYPQLTVHWLVCLLCAVAVWLSLMYPGKAVGMNVSPFFPLHSALGMASYGLFAAAVVHAWLLARTEREFRNAAHSTSGLPVLTLERMTFRFVTAGFVLLTATLLAGVFFTEALYGAPWSWNHKTVFALLSWLVFAVLLLGRWRFGWRGRVALHILYVGALLLLLAYVGSRFVVEVLLH